MIYPLAWTVLTVIRGALDGWYPYPFLDQDGFAKLLQVIGTG